jgi:hypothetical protein
MPKVGEVWTSKVFPDVKLKITEVRLLFSNSDGAIWFDQLVENSPTQNFVDSLHAFLRDADPPATEQEAQIIQVVETAPEPKPVAELLAEMTPEENQAAYQAANTAQTLYEMLRLTKPTVFEAITCCVSLLLEVARDCNVDIDSLCELIKNTNKRLVQHHAETKTSEQAAERASEAS